MSYHLDRAYEEIIRKLVNKDVKVLEGFIKAFPPNNKTKLNALLKVGINNVGKTKDFMETVIKGFMDKKQNKWGGKQGKDFPEFLKRHQEQLSDKLKKKVLDWIDDKSLEYYYPYAQKDLVSITSGWVTDEDKSIKLLNKYYNKLDRDATLHLLGQVTGGEDNPNLKKFREKSVQLVLEKLLALDLKNKAERNTFIKEIAKRPSVIDKVGKTITLTEEDLNLIPPARRLDFLEYIYRPVFSRMWAQRNKNYPYRKPSKTIIKRFQEKRNVFFDIKRNKMKDILFSVSLRKNGQVQEWWDKYKIIEDTK